MLLSRGKYYSAWIFAGLAILTRYEGIFLIPALLIIDWKRPRRWFSGLAICLAMYLPWVWHIYRHLGEFIAFSYPSEFFFQTTRSGAGFIYDLMRFLSPTIVILGILGLHKWPKLQRAGVLVFVIGFVLIHFMWYFRSSRFAIPLVPFLSIGTVLAMQNLLSLKTGRVKLAKIAAIICLLAIIPFDVYAYRSIAPISKCAQKEAVLKILEDDPSAVVLANIDPLLFNWYGGKKIYAWIDQISK